jgi:hypothetical protein
MTEILDVIGGRLAAANVGSLGSTLFLSRMPDTPDACVTVYESGTGYPLYTLGVGGPPVVVTNVQVVARAVREDYPAARTKITAVVAALEAVADGTYDGVRVLRVEQSGRPIPMGYDDNDRPRVAMNFAVTHG